MRRSGYRFIFLLSCSFPASAEIYRCQGEDGEPSFRQRPCGADAVLVVPALPAAAGPAEGIRPSERAWLKQREREQRQSARVKRPRRASTAAREKAAHTQAYKCRSKRRALDEVRHRLRRGYKPARGEKLRRRRAAYEDYLATFCS